MSWREVALEDVPDGPGCYAIYCGGALSYIGQSENVRARLSYHGIRYARYSHSVVTPWGQFHDFRIKVRASQRSGDWLMHEYRLIRRLRPQFNRRHVT